MSLCKHNWTLKSKIVITNSLSLFNLPYCFIGDFFVTLYTTSFCIWSKVPGKPFENLIYCHNENKAPIPSKNYFRLHNSMKYLDATISIDGRFIILMQEKSRSIQM